MKRITFDISEELYYKLKIYCIVNKTSIKDLLTENIKEKIKEG